MAKVSSEPAASKTNRGSDDSFPSEWPRRCGVTHGGRCAKDGGVSVGGYPKGKRAEYDAAVAKLRAANDCPALVAPNSISYRALLAAHYGIGTVNGAALDRNPAAPKLGNDTVSSTCSVCDLAFTADDLVTGEIRNGAVFWRHGSCGAAA